jgi:hypothetical protein
MDPIVWQPTAVLGLVMVGLYVFGCLRGWRRFELAAMVNVVLCSGGVVGGTLLVAGTFIPSLRTSLASLGLYILIGGLAVLAVSVRELFRYIFAREKPVDRA